MIKYSLAESTWGKEEIAAIKLMIEKNTFTMGSAVASFEKEFAHYVGSKYCVMVSSGSAANLLVTASFFYCKDNKLKRGDEVIVPAVSWSTTYYPLHQYGLKLKFVDIDLETLNYDLKALSEAVSDKTKMIVAVNLLGNPNDFSEINNIIGGRDILLWEDNCESMGALFAGKQAGTFGIMGTYSCFFSHHMSTMEGGMIVTDNEEMYHILLSLRAHGWTRSLPKINHVTGSKSDDPFEESYKFVLPGYNVRPLEMSGAIGSEQLKKLDMFIHNRRKNAEKFTSVFQNHPHFYIQKEIGQSSWFGFSIILKKESGIQRKELVSFLEKNGVECRPIVTGNFTKNPVIKYFDYEIHGKLKNAEHLDSHGFFIGNHHFELGDKISLLAELVNSFF